MIVDFGFLIDQKRQLAPGEPRGGGTACGEERGLADRRGVKRAAGNGERRDGFIGREGLKVLAA